MDPLQQFLDVGPKLAAAVLAGGVVGWNRERTERPAGLRTMMLVSLGSASFVLIGSAVMARDPAGQNLSSDPTRVIAGIVGGIGFLGAGTIIRAGREVKGVTTAAAIWTSAAFGAAFGLGLYVYGAIAVALTMLILWLSPVERALFRTGRDNGPDRRDEAHFSQEESHNPQDDAPERKTRSRPPP